MIKSKFLLSFCLTLSLFSLPAFCGDSVAQNVSEAQDGKNSEKFIQDLGDKGIKTLTGKDISEAERRKRFEALFIVAFDYDRIGKFVLGPFRRQVSADDMKEYLGLFKDMVVRVYAARFGEYNHEQFKVTASRANKETMIVSSQILRPNDSKISIEWHMYKDKAGEFKLFDVVVEGVSMALTQRSEFLGILQSGGIKKLMEDLKKKKTQPAKKMIDVTPAPEKKRKATEEAPSSPAKKQATEVKA